MSAFITRLKIDVADFKALLPLGSDFEGVAFDPRDNEVQFRWSNRELVTPFTFHEEFPMQMLKDKQTPKSVKFRKVTIANNVSENTPENIPVDKKPKRGVRKATT